MPPSGEAVAWHLHAFAPDRPVRVCSRHWPALRPFQGIPWARTVCSAGTRRELAPLLAEPKPAVGQRSYGASIHRSLLNRRVVHALHGQVGVITDHAAILERLLATR